MLYATQLVKLSNHQRARGPVGTAAITIDWKPEANQAANENQQIAGKPAAGRE